MINPFLSFLHKPVSNNPWEPLYIRLKQEASNVQRCCVCRMLGAKSEMDPHHTNGRHGVLILDFKWAHPPCHRWIHDNPEKARQRGLYHTMTPLELRDHANRLETRYSQRELEAHHEEAPGDVTEPQVE